VKRVELDGDVLVFRVRVRGIYRDRIYVRDSSELRGNNVWRRIADYRALRELEGMGGPPPSRGGGAEKPGLRALGRGLRESLCHGAKRLCRRVRWPGCRCEDVEWLDESWCRCKRCGALGLGERPREGTRGAKG